MQQWIHFIYIYKKNVVAGYLSSQTQWETAEVAKH